MADKIIEEFEEVEEETIEVEGGLARRVYNPNELASVKDDMFCSMADDGSREVKAAIYNASSNPDHRLKDYINKEIDIMDVLAETIFCEREETGEMEPCPRIVLIDAAGESYECVSVGIFSALKKLIMAYGEPTWTEPVRVIVQEKRVGKGSMLTLKAV